MVTPLDRSLLVRTGGASIAGLALLSGLIALTDEASSTLGMRLARWAALGPAVTALAILGVVAHARARGELRALAALGSPPWRSARGAAWAGLGLAALFTGVLVAPATDTSSLFPVLPALPAWDFDPDGRIARAAGVAVSSAGQFSVAEGASPVDLGAARPGVVAALLCLGPLTLAVPGWSVTPMGAALRAASAGSSAALAVVLLHRMAATGSPSALGALVVVPLALATYVVRWRA